jgi:hypothetical protein
MANVEGRATAITVMTPIKPMRTPLNRLVFWIGAHFKPLMKKLQQLSFIHYARWTIVREIPYNGPPQERERLNYDYLFFESNFNGTWDEYIDAFSEVVPARMKAIWGTSFGFPGPTPVGPFKRYIHKNDYPVQHFYSAYPQATTTEVVSALAVRDRFAPLRRDAAGMSPEEFDAAWVDFLTEIQHDL